MFKRFIWFMAVNFAFVIMISTVAQFLGIDQIYEDGAGDFGLGLDLTNLALYSLLIGFAGAYLSLAISRWFVKRLYKFEMIDETTTDPKYLRVYKKVQEYAARARLPATPEVGVYFSEDINAFATGPSRRRSLVAVSEALLDTLTEDEVDGVLAHEVAHVANGDMVTMTLLQGVVNTFVVFFAKVLTQLLSRGKDGRNGSSFLIEILFHLVLGALGSLIVLKFSRHREFRADLGGASLCGVPKMLAALKKLELIQEQAYGKARSGMRGVYDNYIARGNYAQRRQDETSLSYMKITRYMPRGRVNGWWLLFSSHPPLYERIQSLEAMI